MPKVKITDTKGLVQSSGTGPTNLTAGHKNTVVLSGGGATTLTESDSGATCVFDTAAASTFTLPEPELGMYFTFISSITATGDHEIICPTNAEGFLGGVQIVSTTADETNSFMAAVDGENDYITMNGTTTGGIAGSIVHVVAILASGAARAWVAHGSLLGSGAMATPFADA
jgi:hypothetical protein